jgi:hypothetical protein
MRTTKTRTVIAALAAVAVLSMTAATGVASAAVPMKRPAESPATVKLTTGGTGVAPVARRVAPTDSGQTPVVGPAGPQHVAQVFNPERMRDKRLTCQNLQTLYESSIESAVQIDGNPDGQNQSDEGAAAADKAANDTRNQAAKLGCGWAA